MTTMAQFGGWKEAIDQYHGFVRPMCLICDKGFEHAPPDICDTSCQFSVANHAFYIQILQDDDLVFGTAVMAAIVNQHMTNAIQTEAPKIGIPADKLPAFTNPQVLLHASGHIPAPVLKMLKTPLVDSIHLGFWFLLAVAAFGFISSFFAGSARFDPVSYKEKQAATMPKPVEASV